MASDRARRALLELQLAQHARHPRTWVTQEADEASSMKRLARSVFGDRTSIHIDQPGVWQIGYFTAPRFGMLTHNGQGLYPDPRSPSQLPHLWPRKVIFVVRSHRELVDQLALWRRTQ